MWYTLLKYFITGRIKEVDSDFLYHQGVNKEPLGMKITE